MKEISHSRVSTLWRHLGGALLFGAFLVTTSAGAFGATYKVLRNFDAGHGGGATPGAGLILDAAGNLYGTTSRGGLTFGVVFRLEPLQGGGYKEVVLHNFTGG